MKIRSNKDVETEYDGDGSEMSDMKERLCRQHVINGEMRFVNPDGNDGAREIDRLEQKIDRLQEIILRMDSLIGSGEAALTVARQAAKETLGDE